MIEIKNVSKIYQNKKQTIKAVDDVSLTIQDGEIYGIIGYSGAGKSTLLRMINSLEKPTMGTVWIDQQNVSELNKKALNQARMKIGMIFQHFNLLWSRTVIENIELPLEIAGLPSTKRRVRAKELIELVGLTGKENSYPSELSGGQKQRVGIARALANRPTVLLCDEATSALDPDTTESILDLLVKINQELHLTIVLITHQMEVVQKICHRVAVMVEGKVVEEGSMKDIFLKPKHVVTKRFVGEERSYNQETDLKTIYTDGMLYKLTFTQENSRQPILSQAIRHSDLDISIVQAKLTNTQEVSFGTMYIHASKCDDQKHQCFIQFLKDKNVLVEVI